MFIRPRATFLKRKGLALRRNSGEPLFPLRLIAEGYKKLGKADKLRFMNIAEGSLEECRDYMVLARDLGYINAAAFEMPCESAGQTGKMLHGYSNGILKNNAIKD